MARSPSSSQRPPSLLVSTAAPAQPVPSPSHVASSSTNSPFRYVRVPDVKSPIDHPLSRLSPSPTTTSPVALPPPRPRPPARRAPPPPPPPPPPPLPPQTRARPQGFRIPDRLKPWLAIASWALTSLAFLLALAFWKRDVFAALDRLALYLQALGYTGHAILFVLIFITTIPPVPLYSTLIVLSGYTFGTWTGAAISYSAALSGALSVFLLARHFLRARMARLLAHTRALQRVVRAIERRPRLLLLIRIAPYPYNLMNVLLAASHALPFRTYAACTALSLAKVLVHTSLGASMHSFSHDDDNDDSHSNGAARAWTVFGVLLCIALFVYLSLVARRAVDDELDADPTLDLEAPAAAAEMREVLH